MKGFHVSLRRKTAVLAATIGVVALATTVGATSASANFGHCPTQYFCTYADNAGGGYPNDELKDSNSNWAVFGGVGLDGSAYNNGTSGMGVTVYDKWGYFDYCTPYHGGTYNAGHIGGSNFWGWQC
jgi:hypothetical protein